MNVLDQTICAPFNISGVKSHAVLLLHGFTSSAASMRPVAEPLCAAGFPVYAPNLKGHGSSVKDMRDVSWRDWRDDALGAFDRLLLDHQHVSIIGHSMGALLALLTAGQRPVWKCIALAPPLKSRMIGQYFAPLASCLRPTIPWKSLGDQSDDAKASEYDLVGYDELPTARLWDLNRLAWMARRHLRRIHCPVLCVSAARDTVVHSDSADWMMKGVSSKGKKHLHLENSDHNLMFGNESELLHKEILSFLGNL